MERAAEVDTPRLPAAWPLLVLLVFGVLSLGIYRAALHGPPISDDAGYLVSHPYTASLSAENVAAMIDPFGPARLYTANYAPVHLLLTAVERQIFADAVLGYHLVNVLVHAAAATLLVALLLAAGVAARWALLGGLLFAVHPANVEAVAWMSQLKTNAALALALGALLLRRRSPPLGALLFAAALLTKASAAFALPMAAAQAWCRREGRTAWIEVGAWAALLGLYAIPQSASFAHTGAVDVDAYTDPWVHARTVAGIGARYLVMAYTSLGVAAFQEPPPSTSWLDPWWLLALPSGALLGWRLVAGLARRREEAAWWVAAAAAFAPVSQVFPFAIPLADRYLYTMLPGLIGGTLLAAQAESGRIGALLARLHLAPQTAGRAALGLGVAAAVLFAVQSAGRAALWRNETLLLVDAATQYPDGITAHYLRARRAAQAGDTEAALAALRAASARGLDTFAAVRGDPGLAPLRGEPGFQEVIHEMAGRWLERATARGYATQAELRARAHAHLARREYAEAEAALEGALAAGGPQDAQIRSELAALRVRRAAEGGGDGDSAQER